MSDPLLSEPSKQEDQVLREVHVMLRYALAAGLDIDDRVREAINAVRRSDPSTGNLDALMVAHAALVKIVAPATPTSLEATEPVPGLFGFLRRPPLIGWMIGIALVSAVGFISTSVELTRPPQEKTDKSKSSAESGLWNPSVRMESLRYIAVALATTNCESSPVSPWKARANWLFGAALGASFYVLFTAHEYVKTRTFDPKYNSVYLVRFVLGVIAGLILALMTPAFSDNEKLQKLGPAVVALLGGFSAEAVYQVLQRFVDILLAAVRGDNSAAAKAKVSQTAQQELLSIAADPTLPNATRDKVHESIRKLGR